MLKTSFKLKIAFLLFMWRKFLRIPALAKRTKMGYDGLTLSKTPTNFTRKARVGKVTGTLSHTSATSQALATKAAPSRGASLLTPSKACWNMRHGFSLGFL